MRGETGIPPQVDKGQAGKSAGRACSQLCPQGDRWGEAQETILKGVSTSPRDGQQPLQEGKQGYLWICFCFKMKCLLSTDWALCQVHELIISLNPQEKSTLP